jgi:tetratricopeptide (TPR) repeat protein
MNVIRSKLIEEARRFRDLGRYIEARNLYRKAANVENDLLLSLEVSGMLMEQGLVAVSLDKVNSALTRFRQDTSDEVALALAEMLQSFGVAATTMQFSEPLRIGTGIYKKYLLNLPVHQYQKTHVSLQGVFLQMRVLAETCGFDVSTTLTPPVHHLDSLYHQLINEQRYEEALRIAKHYSRVAQSQYQATLLEKFVSETQIPNLEKARGLEYLVDLTNDRESSTHLEEALKLYEAEKHVTGPLLLMIRKQKRRLPSESNKRREIRNALLKVKQDLESLGEYMGTCEAIIVLYDIAREELDSQLRTQLDQEMQRLEVVRNYPLRWMNLQYQLALQWDVVGPSIGQSLESLEAMWHTLESTEAPLMRVRIAHLLSKKYRSLGNSSTSDDWTTKATNDRMVGPRYMQFTHGADDFYRRV